MLVPTDPEEGSMELVTKKHLYLVSGRASQSLATDIARDLGVPLGDAGVGDFSNGEIHCRYKESIRGTDVFIVNTHSEFEGNSINDALMEQLIMVDAARRASAKRITVVVPFYAYARQDRKASGREPITAKLVANLFKAAGASRLVSVDLHSSQIQGFFDGPVDHLTAMPVLLDYMQDLGPGLVVVSPDAGRVKVAERYAKSLNADLAIVHKRRSTVEKNSVEARDVVGDVEGRVCVVIDDMIDTGSTIVAAAELLHEKGAEAIYAVTTHGVFSGPAIDRLKNSVIRKVVCTDTLPLPSEKQIDKIETISVAPILARAIHAIFEDASVSEIFGDSNYS